MIDFKRFLDLNEDEFKVIEAIPLLLQDAKSIVLAFCFEFPDDDYINININESNSSKDTIIIRKDIQKVFELLLARYIVKMNFAPEKDSNNNYTYLGELALKAEKIIDYSFMIEESYND